MTRVATMPWRQPAPGRATIGAVTANSTGDGVFLRACRREPVAFTPVWFMRQAGRALPEYRRVRAGVPMLESCTRVDMVVEITMQPVRRYGVDAAVLFSDIVLPLKAAGVELDIVAGRGPVMAHPLSTPLDVARLPELEPDQVGYVAEAVRALVGELGETPLIGFAGAPYTLASYLIEGGPSKEHARTRALMRSHPQLWHDLLDRLARLSATFLTVQLEAGAAAVQLFDSWAGSLAASDYAEFVLPHSATVLESVAGFGAPRIHFGVGTGELLGLMARAGADVVGVDWRVPLDEAARRVGPTVALQGNLDPAAALGSPESLARQVERVLACAEGLPGHVFNLGHGVLPETDPDQLTRVVELVHERTRR